MKKKLSKREIKTQKEREERASKVRYKLERSHLKEKEAQNELREFRP